VIATEIKDLLKAVAKVKGKPAAFEVKKQALKVLGTPEVRNALDPP